VGKKGVFEKIFSLGERKNEETRVASGGLGTQRNATEAIPPPRVQCATELESGGWESEGGESFLSGREPEKNCRQIWKRKMIHSKKFTHRLRLCR